MSSSRRSMRLFAAAAALLVIAVSIWAAVPAFSAQQGAAPADDRFSGTAGTQAQSDANGGVTTATDAAYTRISTPLRNATGTVSITVYHNVSAKDALLKIAPELRTRAYVMPSGSTVSIGQVSADKLVKLAAVSGVEFIVENSDKKPAEVGIDGDVVRPQPDGAKLNTDAKAKGLKPTNANIDRAADKPAQPEDWYDVDVEHNARQAWDNGYTGEGVIVAVVDSGVDFGHPDLQGTQATIPNGDYAGWVYAFDDYSTAYWELFGAAQTIGEWNSGFQSIFVDTSMTLSAPSGVTTTHVITTPYWSRDGVVAKHPRPLCRM